MPKFTTLKKYAELDKSLELRKDKIYCTYCVQFIGSDQKGHIEAHLTSKNHQTAVKQHQRQLTLSATFNEGGLIANQQKENCKALCKAFVEAGIPLNKLSHPSLRNYLESVTNRPVPTESLIRKVYLPQEAEKQVQVMREALSHEHIWITIDETTDATGRSIALVLAGALTKTEHLKPHFVLAEELQQVNNTTIAQCFSKAISHIWPEEPQFNKVLLFVTDAAAYMICAYKALQPLYPKMIHVTCLAHGLSRVAEQVRKEYPLVNSYIAAVKSVFVKAPGRIRRFKHDLPNLPLPPEPCLTRWGTWLDAAMYHADYFGRLSPLLQSFNSDEAAAIEEVQDLIREPKLQQQLAIISVSYASLRHAITCLETVGLSLNESVSLVDEVTRSISNAPGPEGDHIRKKLGSVISKNDGYLFLKAVNNVLQAGDGAARVFENHTVDELVLFTFAPITSCDVERSFSRLKSIFSDRRRRLLVPNLSALLAISMNTESSAAGAASSSNRLTQNEEEQDLTYSLSLFDSDED